MSQWANGLNVHTYVDNEVPFVTGPYNIPVNPTGGDQFVGEPGVLLLGVAKLALGVVMVRLDLEGLLGNGRPRRPVGGQPLKDVQGLLLGRESQHAPPHLPPSA